MFTYRMGEEHTGVRDGGEGLTFNGISRSRPTHAGHHEQSIVDSLRFNVENFDVWMSAFVSSGVVPGCTSIPNMAISMQHNLSADRLGSRWKVTPMEIKQPNS